MTEEKKLVLRAIKDPDTRNVLKFFRKICQVPRESKREEKMTRFLANWAKRQGIPCQVDEIGNVIMDLPATKGLENRTHVILQAHMDMVCVKDKNKKHDFAKDPITPYIQNGWICADGTSLGADDGIGVAIMMSILSNQDSKHGHITCIFTVDEETGLTGAKKLQLTRFPKGTFFFNLDAEEFGRFYTGSAGGGNIDIQILVKEMPTPIDTTAFNLFVGKGKGGHSGVSIHESRANAIKILAQIIDMCKDRDISIYLNSLIGGSATNAIPKEAQATVCVNDVQAFLQCVDEMAKYMKGKYKGTDPDLEISAQETTLPSNVLDETSQDNLINGLVASEHGVVEMSKTHIGFVSSSVNLAMCKKDDGGFTITVSYRSDDEIAKQLVCRKIRAQWQKVANVRPYGEYLAWTPSEYNPALELAKWAYSITQREDPRCGPIHAGLEVGEFYQQRPDFFIVSLGPTIENPHSPDEKCLAETVGPCLKVIKRTIENVPIVNNPQ